MRSLHRFKPALLVAATFIGAGAAHAAEHEVVRCTGELLGAPTFTVTADSNDEGIVQSYRLMKYPNNPFYGPYSVEVARENVLTYGETFILTVNAGRSGYAHVFFHGDTVVIDVDLFQQPDMGTNGAQTRYRCTRDEPASWIP